MPWILNFIRCDKYGEKFITNIRKLFTTQLLHFILSLTSIHWFVKRYHQFLPTSVNHCLSLEPCLITTFFINGVQRYVENDSFDSSYSYGNEGHKYFNQEILFSDIFCFLRRTHFDVKLSLKKNIFWAKSYLDIFSFVNLMISKIYNQTLNSCYKLLSRLSHPHTSSFEIKIHAIRSSKDFSNF